jgi:phage/plasmid-associated DNA primase
MRAVAFPLNYDAAKEAQGHSIAIFSQGGGSNGKDTLNNLLRKIYGQSATAAVQLNQFKKADSDGSFQLAALGAARLNMPSETSCAYKIDNLKTLKAVTTGDPILVERKGENAYSITPRITQLYTTNNEFIMNNAKEADERRYYVLEWPVTYTADETLLKRNSEVYKPRDVRFLGGGSNEEWLLKNVLPGFFNILLDYYEEVCTKGFADLRPYSRNVVQKMGRDINHVKEFLEDLGIKHFSATYHEQSPNMNDVYQLYLEWCVPLGRAIEADEDLDGTKTYEPKQITHGADRTCMNISDLCNRLKDSGYITGRTNQKQAERLNLRRGVYIQNAIIPES